MKTVKQQTQYSVAYNIYQPEFKSNNMYGPVNHCLEKSMLTALPTSFQNVVISSHSYSCLNTMCTSWYHVKSYFGAQSTFLHYLTFYLFFVAGPVYVNVCKNIHVKPTSTAI